MPVTILRQNSHSSIAELTDRRVKRGATPDRQRRLRIELINNMPDAAFFNTQRQFTKLIEEGSQDFDVELGLVNLESIERGAEVKREMADLYRSPSYLAAAPPDAIIVTGAEPRAPALEEEPYWRELTSVFDLARAHAYATLASCLAAHALTLHLDRVRRRRYARKWSGVYQTEIATGHPLTRGLLACKTPHSRWNGLDEGELTSAGYVVLTRSPEAGVDAFAKDDGHLSLFFQGHPEYDSDSLAREYRRDVLRAAQGGVHAPEPPANYYAPETEQRLRAHVAGVLAGRETAHLPAVAMEGPEAEWRRSGAVMIGNWLAEIAARKHAANATRAPRARFGG